MPFTTDRNEALTLCAVAPNFEATEYTSAEGAVKKVTAFSSVADMMDTQESYSIKFCVSREKSATMVALMFKVADCFNEEAEKRGQARRAVFF